MKLQKLILNIILGFLNIFVKMFKISFLYSPGRNGFLLVINST